MASPSDPGPLFTGSFYTPVGGRATRVNLVILADYCAKASFESQGRAYEFRVDLWAKGRKGKFDSFVNLVRFQFPETNDFQTVTVEGDVTTITRTRQQTVDMIKYAVAEVFACADEIITTQRGLLDYAARHRELGKCSTYEEFIHLAACRCLVDANFRTLDASLHGPVEFCDEGRAYRPGILKTFVER
jgi:hypothetical protein